VDGCSVISEISTLYPKVIGVKAEIVNKNMIPIARMFLFRSMPPSYTNIYAPDDI